MKFRVTPLNFVSAGLISFGAYFILFSYSHGAADFFAVATMAIMCFLADVLFRTYFKTTRVIWIVEVLFTIFAILILMLIKRC